MGQLGRSGVALAAIGLLLLSALPTIIYWASFAVIQGVVFLGIAIYWLIQNRNRAQPTPLGIFASGCAAEFAFICVTEPFVEQPSLINELVWLAFGTAASACFALLYYVWRKRFEPGH